MKRVSRISAVAVGVCAVAVTGVVLPQAVATEPGADNGAVKHRGFVAAYEKGKKPPHAAEEKWLKKTRLLENVAGNLNKRLRIPATIVLSTRSCGQPDASYGNGRVVICYEFVAEVRGMFQKARDKDVARKTADVVTETLYHEAGHALLERLDLPYTGREEDVADQFAAYNLIPQGVRGQRTLLAAAENYDLYAKDEPVEDIDFSDEHTPNAARSATYRSYLYGADPKRWKRLVDVRHLTRERSQISQDEYTDLRQGWSHLLRPYTTGA